MASEQDQDQDVDGSVRSFDRLNLDSDEKGVDIVSVIQDLSPTAQQSLGVLLRSISNGDAYIDYDANGKQVIEYKEVKRNRFYDASHANVIATPRSDEEVKLKIDACLELVKYLKSEKPSSGVLMDRTKIHVPPSKQYREGHEFVKTKQVLGSGNSAGDIIVVKDKKTGHEHAQKTMMISVFREDEIRCWADMSVSGYAPSLYLFRIENNKVSIHMEILQKATTLRSIIDDYMSSISEKDKSLIKPFSLYVLKGALDAVSTLHQKGWGHHDLHAGNLMLQRDTDSSLKVKILDFGLAKKFQGPLGLDFEGFRKDIGEIVRLFSALYTGEEFDNVRDVRNNWKTKLSEIAQYLSVEDRRELFCLIDGALKLVHPDDVHNYRSHVNKHLSHAMEKEEKQIMKKVVAILFADEATTRDKPMSKNVSDSVVPDFAVISKCDEADSLQTDRSAAMVTDEILEMIRLEFSI